MNSLDYEEFWNNLYQEDDAEDGVNAIRILAELYAEGVYMRDGDFLLGQHLSKSYLARDDQHLIRRITEAVDQSTEEN